jgi:hypothetical protein
LATKITDRTNLPISVFPVMFWEGINVLLWYAIHELWRGLETLAERPAPLSLSFRLVVFYPLVHPAYFTAVTVRVGTFVAGVQYSETYGKDYADGYIQIHHIKPLSKNEGEVDPRTDLVPLCANCHAIAHRRRDTVTPIEELKALIEKAKG